MNRIAQISLASLAVAAVACKGDLPQETSSLDLSDSGLALALEVPSGAEVRKESSSVVVEWGPHGEQGSIDLSKRKPELVCTGQDENCKVLEQDETSMIKQVTFVKRELIKGVAHLAIEGADYQCLASGPSQAVVKRLLDACKTAKASGKAVADGKKPAAKPGAAAPTLQKVAVEIDDRGSPLKYSIEVPEGHTVLESGTGRTFSSPKSVPIREQVSVAVNPYLSVKSMADAEKQFNSLGLGAIADKRELSKTSFLLKDAPRGTGGFLTVVVFANSEKRTVMARCFGPASLGPTLEAMCTSLKLD